MYPHIYQYNFGIYKIYSNSIQESLRKCYEDVMADREVLSWKGWGDVGLLLERDQSKSSLANSQDIS
jgi:hypothetical protein